MTDLQKDFELRLPNLTVVSASAGSGKTYALAMRLLQLLLSEKIPHGKLPHILALTFTNNATQEMKQRVFSLLKKIYFGDEKIIAQLCTILSLSKEQLRWKAERLLEELFECYSDIHIHTLDSFLITVFQSTSLEYGFLPQTEISLDKNSRIERTFEEFFLNASVHQTEFLKELILLIEKQRSTTSSFLWNPYKNLLNETKELYTLIRTQTKNLDTANFPQLRLHCEEQLIKHARLLLSLIEESKLPFKQNFLKDLHDVVAKNILALLPRTIKDSEEKIFNKVPDKQRQISEQYLPTILSATTIFYETLSRFVFIESQSYYAPYVNMLRLLEQTMDDIAKREGSITLDDVQSILKEHWKNSLVPEIYFKFGEAIKHYLIDEFQDTSPIQWYNIKLLLEELLSKDGSLFVVGDTKQSIYGFRGADWEIMQRLEQGKEFDSVLPTNLQLGTNYRSGENIVRFNEQFFTKILPATEYKSATDASGLSIFHQQATKGNENEGFVRVLAVKKSDIETNEKIRLLENIRSCIERGFRFDDIAILSFSNDEVVLIGSWLNENNIPFISHSSLDIRNRKCINEIFSLLKFLSSPLDNLSFATFTLSDVFLRTLSHNASRISEDEIHQCIFSFHTKDRAKQPLYKIFMAQFPLLWEEYFARLFSSIGYLPLYDVVSYLYKTFEVHTHFPEEEAALNKLLEVVFSFEQKERSSLHDFLQAIEHQGETGQWDISATKHTNAITLMTVHKAKGLSFPIVFVMLYDKELTKENLYVDASENNVQLLHITKELAKHNSTLQNIRDEHFLISQADM